MGFPVYDYRTDIRNVLVTPEIRARFLRMEPGQSAQLHSHDLGHEVFLILEGRVEFEIDGETEELGPGQMCVALADQPHRVRVLGDEPMTMYLSVTPHVHPTHTPRTDEGRSLTPNFMPASAYDVEPNMDVSVDELVSQLRDAVSLLTRISLRSMAVQEDYGHDLKTAVAEGDEQAAIDARMAMWGGIYPLFKLVAKVGDIWNELAPRATQKRNP